MVGASRTAGKEVFFPEDDIIVSKTDLKGRITYANRTFCRIAGYREQDVVGQPHSIIRHPDMPRAVFRLLWNQVLSGQEIFAYVKNRTKHGDFYWVFAHVTPSRDRTDAVVGFHSNRRVPKRSAIDTVSGLYGELIRIEAQFANAKEGLEASFRALTDHIKGRKTSYDEFVLAL